MPSSVVFNSELKVSVNASQLWITVVQKRQIFESKWFPAIKNFPFKLPHYNAAVDTLDLVLMQEVPAGTPHSDTYAQYTIGDHRVKGDRGVGYEQMSFLVTQKGEGKFRFTTLQASLEDAIGISKMQKVPTGEGQKTISLLRPHTLRALLLLDFWNPIYSWQRGVLMQYVPETTTLVQGSGDPSFDLEENFVTAIEVSSPAKEDGSPEQRFLKLRSQFADSSDGGDTLFKSAVGKYCDVSKPL